MMQRNKMHEQLWKHDAATLKYMLWKLSYAAT